MDWINTLAEQLRILNERNLTADFPEFLDLTSCPPECRPLAEAVNKTIELGNAKVQQEKNNLRIINSIIQSGMWTMNFNELGEMTKVTWTPAFREMLGFHSKEEFPDELCSWSDRLHPEDRDATLTAYWNAIAGNGSYDVEYRLRTRSGAYQWFRATGEVVRRENGTPLLFIGIFIDITQKKDNERLILEKKKAQLELEHSRQEKENQNRILSALGSDYFSIYRVNFSTGAFEIFRLSEHAEKDLVDILMASDNYDTAMEQCISRFVREDDQEYVLAMTRRSYVLSRLQERDFYFVRYHTGKNRLGAEHFEIHFASAGLQDGDPIVIVGFRNVDDIVKKENIYKLETQHAIEETLEGARTGLWTIELENGCPPRMYADKTMRMLLDAATDISPEDCYQRWFERIAPDYVDMVLECIREMCEKGRAEVTYPWNHPSLGQLYVRCGGVPDHSFDRKGRRLKGYHQDITETVETRKKQEKALMKALEEAKQANRAKTEFLSHMSHDIRTPINGILGMLTICEKNSDHPERQKDCLDKIRTSAEHLLSLINDVLDISKLESGTTPLTLEPFNLNDVLENCLNILRIQAQENGLSLNLESPRLPRPCLLGSPLHIRQVLLNIMSNALKYNRPGGTVTVLAEDITDTGLIRDPSPGTVYCRFIIRDTGIGISKEFLNHIFEPFTQENNNARTHYKGTGLGMAIAKNLVDQMNGSISVTSELGKGSEFTVILPFPIQEQTDAAEASSPSGNSDRQMPADISGMKILLVEDNDLNQEIARYMLEEAGASVMTAENGLEAVKQFTSSSPGEIQCILMDIMMPVMDGLEATRQIRASLRPDASTVPIIAMTANAFSEDAQKGKEAGMDEYLTKPLDYDRMLHVISARRQN